MAEDDFLHRLWRITNEITQQHRLNKDLASGLSSQLSILKQRASENSSGQEQAEFPNLQEGIDGIEIPDDSATNKHNDLAHENAVLLQKYNTTLSRNQSLQEECSGLDVLLKEYETNVKTITDQLRLHINATAEGQTKLRREYEALLDAEKSTTAALYKENITLQTRLHKLASILRTLQDDSVNDEQEALIAQLITENAALREMLHLPLHQESQPYSTVPKEKNVKSILVAEKFINQDDVMRKYFYNQDL
ncbi:hypothetical protein BDF14DRAFT_1837840 [Spinellus fusiger]|nr:hypothetical protein BDF14DRAFT_1837840 [Spinellus fusiger]